jgi:hypothetical protein
MSELTGVDWRWELGGKHWKLMVNGRQVLVWPKGKISWSHPHDLGNARARIRQSLR